MVISWRCLILWLTLLCLAACQQTIGGVTIEDAFSDAQVVKLLKALADNDYREADKLIAAGADVNFVGLDGVTPLLWTIGMDDLDDVEYLLKAGANPNYRIPEHHASPMQLAAERNNPRLLKILLENGGDPNFVGDRNLPILHIAVEQFRRQNVEILLKHGADINSLVNGDRDRNAAFAAIAMGDYEMAVYLVENGLNCCLQEVAAATRSSHVRPDSDAQRWKDKLIQMLEARGITVYDESK